MQQVLLTLTNCRPGLHDIYYYSIQTHKLMFFKGKILYTMINSLSEFYGRHLVWLNVKNNAHIQRVKTMFLLNLRNKHKQIFVKWVALAVVRSLYGWVEVPK